MYIHVHIHTYIHTPVQTPSNLDDKYTYTQTCMHIPDRSLSSINNDICINVFTHNIYIYIYIYI